MLFQDDFRHDGEMVRRIFVAVVVVDGGVFEDAHVAAEEDEVDFAFGRLFGIVAVGVERLERPLVGRFADVFRVFHLGEEGLDGGCVDAAVLLGQNR